MQLSVYFNGRCKVFIVCVVGSGKMGLIYKIYFIDGYYSYTHGLPFHTDKVAIDGQVCFFIPRISGCQSDPGDM